MLFFIAFLVLCLSDTIRAHDNFVTEPPSSGDDIIPRTILINYIKKYIINDKVYISLVLGLSQKQQSHIRNWVINDVTRSEIVYDIAQTLGSTACDNTNAFNIIFIKDSESLK